MATRPHDVTDLYLAPVAISLDAALDELDGQSAAELGETIALRTNREPAGGDERRAAMLDAVTHLVELHEWQVSWDARGLELAHDGHRLVLGLPQNVRDYLEL